MINHVRTLLLNPTLPGSGHYVGDEFVPAEFGHLTIPSKFDRVRKIIFGPAADRAMMNYRLLEIMTMLHTTELEEFVLEFDPRVTYWPPPARGIFDGAFGVTIVPEHSTAGSSAIIQETIQRSVDGQLYEEWHVTVTGASAYSIRRNSTPVSTVTGSFSGNIGIPLPGSNLLIRLQSPGIGDSYLVKALKRPQHDLASVAEQLRTGMGAETQAELFYRTNEPFKTFTNLWFDHEQLAYKFGGLILSLAHRLDEIRTGKTA